MTMSSAIPSSSPSPSSNGHDPLSPFEVEKAEPKDAREILEFLYTDFLQNEPLNVALDLRREECGNFFAELVEMSLVDGLSFIVRDPTANGKLVALRLANIVHRNGETMENGAENGTERKNRRKMSNGHAFSEEREENEKVRCINSVLHLVESKIWTLVPEEMNTLLYWLIISVDAKYKRRGIARALVLHRLDEAIRFGCQGVVTEASAFNSQKLFEKLGYKRLFELKHSDFKDEKGKQIFQCKDGTDRLTLEFKVLN